ncbi:hypothetical protein QL285_088040 [Trifolium repens]|nr:hypothetical protein QL285_088040 [Trifolium repens]
MDIQHLLQKVSQSDPYLQSFISRRPHVRTPPGDNDPCQFKFIEFLPRILCGSRSPQVHPPRTTLSKEIRDTCRLNSTKARGFTIPLTEASLPALLQ